MPRDWIGQMITFAAERDPDADYTKYTYFAARDGDTIRAIAARRGHPEWAPNVLDLNKNRDVLPHPKRQPHQSVPPVPKLHSTTQRLRTGAQIRLPGIMSPGESLSVHAGNDPPIITAGYAKYDTVDVPARLGISRFLGYDPLAIDVPVQFEEYAYGSGVAVERDIAALERMAGRGGYPGSTVGPPAIIRVSVTDNSGNVVPLIPADYQWSAQHTNAPLWRITGLAWDAGALRTTHGYRMRQTGTVSITQYTPTRHVERSVKQRTEKVPSRTANK